MGGERWGEEERWNTWKSSLRLCAMINRSSWLWIIILLSSSLVSKALICCLRVSLSAFSLLFSTTNAPTSTKVVNEVIINLYGVWMPSIREKDDGEKIEAPLLGLGRTITWRKKGARRSRRKPEATTMHFTYKLHKTNKISNPNMVSLVRAKN